MADTFKIIDGPSEMDVMWSLFRNKGVTFEVETDGVKRREMYLREMSNPHSVVAKIIAEHAHLDPGYTILLHGSEKGPFERPAQFFMAYQPGKREGLLTEMGGVRGIDSFGDPFRLAWGDLIFGSSDWRRSKYEPIADLTLGIPVPHIAPID